MMLSAVDGLCADGFEQGMISPDTYLEERAAMYNGAMMPPPRGMHAGSVGPAEYER